MNKYLLLRDNKQSGPYTAADLIAKGIKPYDLVWLEGKSAAWRYPSEVEELKAHSPAVEEQPFDRFYRKPAETPQKPIAEPIVETHQQYQPKPVPPASEDTRKKVYINFPASANAQGHSKSVKPATLTTGNEKAATTNETPGFGNKTLEAVPSNTSRNSNYVLDTNVETSTAPSRNTAAPMRIRKENKVLQVALAACILLGIVSGILFFNYYRQKEALNKLNSLVQQIEQREKQPQTVPATLVQNEIPQEANVTSTADIPQSPGEIVPVAAEESSTGTPLPQPVRKKQQPAKVEVEPAPAEQSVVFRENKPGERPVQRRGEETIQNAETTNAQPGESLYKMIDVKPNAYKTGLLGGISNLKFELTNRSSVELQRVAVEVKYLGPEKKVVKTHTIYFQNVSPGGQSTVEVPKSNRGVTIEYTVTDIKS